MRIENRILEEIEKGAGYVNAETGNGKFVLFYAVGTLLQEIFPFLSMTCTCILNACVTELS